MGNFLSGFAQYFYQALLESREEAVERLTLHFNHRTQEAVQSHFEKTEKVLLGSDELVARYFIAFLCQGIRTSVLPHPDEQRRQLLDHFDKVLEKERTYFQKQERLALQSLGRPTSRL